MSKEQSSVVLQDSQFVREAIERFFTASSYPMIFTGAGVSVKTGLPTWKGLVEQMAEGIRPYDPLTTQMMLECVRTGELTLAVDYFNLSSKWVEGEKRKLLARLLTSSSADSIIPMAKLPFRGCLTTNFDRSMLDAIAAGRKQSARDYKFGDASFAQAQWEENLFVARIHGAVEVPQSMILSEAQFRDVLANEAYADFLRTCFVHRNVLFLGFSFYDPAIRHIFADIDRRFGPATPGRHMALLPRDSNSEFLQKAGRLNIEVVPYDSGDGHAALWDGIKAFTRKKAAVTAEGPDRAEPFEFTKKYLAACYARAQTQSASAPLREAVLEGIVSALLQEASPKALSHVELLENIRSTLGIKGREAETIYRSATRSLIEAGLCRKLKGETGRASKYAWIGDIATADTLDSAFGALSESVAKRAYLQEGWKTGKEVNDSLRNFFSQLVRRRGWDLGAAFAAGRPPENASIQALLLECCVGLSAFDRERLVRICSNMIQQPSHEESSLLGELGRVSFAVELAFQSPTSVLIHKATLPRHIYFDASVLLPLLVEGHPLRSVYRDAIKKLKSAAAAAAVPLRLMVSSVYLNEIISHRRNAEQYSTQAGEDFPAIARSDALFHGGSNINVYVGAYANYIEFEGALTFKDFLAKTAPYSSESALAQWLKREGFEVVNSFKGAKYAEFYASLELAYAGALSNGKQPILIEHDSIQLSVLENERIKGERALFVTADRQLQNAIAGSKNAELAELIISHVGLIQFIQLLLGGIPESGGLTELLWSTRVSNRSQAVRAHFVALGLEQYDEGMTMAMPQIIERFADAAVQELERTGADLETDDPRKRADSFRVLGSLERNYLTGMSEAVAKLKEGPFGKKG
jgi:hypothetical protein